MLDKKLAYTLLAILLVVFTIVTVVTVRQWKQISKTSTAPQLYAVKNKGNNHTQGKRVDKTKQDSKTKEQQPPKDSMKQLAVSLDPKIDRPSLLAFLKDNGIDAESWYNEGRGQFDMYREKNQDRDQLQSQTQPFTVSVIEPPASTEATNQSTEALSTVPISYPIYTKPDVVDEPNFDCSPANTFTSRVDREYVFYADSACRDFELYPESGNYFFRFPTAMYNVKSIDIIQALIPKGEDLINVNNQTFYIQEPPNNPVAITLDKGDYLTDGLLAIEITNKLNAAGLINTYLVTSAIEKLTFTRTAGASPFQLLFTPEYDPYALVRQMLGFPPYIVPDIAGVIAAPYKTVLSAVQFVDVVSPDICKNFPDNPVMARIPLTGGALNNVTEYDPATIGTRTFWPIEKLTGITLQFFAGPTCPALSVLYNFNGLDNSLTLKVTCIEYKNIFIDDYCIQHMI